MHERIPKSKKIFFCVTPEDHHQLHELAFKMKMTASELVRELVVGLIEGRVTVTPPKDKESLYNVT